MDVRATTSRPQHKVQSRRVHNAREKSFPQGVRVSKGTKRLGIVDGQIYKTTYSTYNDFTTRQGDSISCAKFTDLHPSTSSLQLTCYLSYALACPVGKAYLVLLCRPPVLYVSPSSSTWASVSNNNWCKTNHQFIALKEKQVATGSVKIKEPKSIRIRSCFVSIELLLN